MFGVYRVRNNLAWWNGEIWKVHQQLDQMCWQIPHPSVKHHKWTTFHIRNTEHWAIQYTFTLQNVLAVLEWNLFKSKSHTKFISQSYNQRCNIVMIQFHWFLVLHLRPNSPIIPEFYGQRFLKNITCFAVYFWCQKILTNTACDWHATCLNNCMYIFESTLCRSALALASYSCISNNVMLAKPPKVMGSVLGESMNWFIPWSHLGWKSLCEYSSSLQLTRLPFKHFNSGSGY